MDTERQRRIETRWRRPLGLKEALLKGETGLEEQEIRFLRTHSSKTQDLSKQANICHDGLLGSLFLGFADQPQSGILIKSHKLLALRQRPHKPPHSPFLDLLNLLEHHLLFPPAGVSTTSAVLSNKANLQAANNVAQLPWEHEGSPLPVTIGSVAEVPMPCSSNRNTDAQPNVIPSPPPRNAQPCAATAGESADRDARDADESGSENYERVGDDREGPWMVPPPSYAAAVTAAPAYT